MSTKIKIREKGKPINDLPFFRKKYANQEKNRLMRLREAKQVGSIKKMVHNLVASDLKPKILTDQQRMAIYYMVDFTHPNRTYGWIAAKLGISVKVLCQWKNDTLFLREMNKEIDKRQSYMRLQAYKNIFRDIKNGSVKSSFNYLKMTGDFTEKVDITIDNSGEKELDDDSLTAEIEELKGQLSTAHTPSDN